MKKIKRIIMLILLTLTITGCVKMEISMDINKDKSMNLGIIQAVDKSLLEGADSSSLIDEEERKELEEEGFKIEDYSENNMIGHKIIKEVKNIDEISTENDITADLGTSSLADSEYMFTVKKGLFKNTYKAVLKNSDTDELDESLNSGLTDDTTDDEYLEDDFTYDEDYNYDEDYTYDDTEDYTDDYLTDEDYYDTTEDDYTSSGIEDFDYTDLMSSMDLTMKVNLPYKALSNNATLVENEGKTLTWDLMSFHDETIEFEFEIYNTTNIIIVVASGILVLVLLIVLIVKKLKKKNNNNTIDTANTQPISNTDGVQQTDNTISEQSLPTLNQVSTKQPAMATPAETNQMTTFQEQTINNMVSNNNIDLINIPTQPQVGNIVTPVQQPMTNSIELNNNNTETTSSSFATLDQNSMTSFNMVNEAANQPINNIAQPNNNILESQSTIPQVPLTTPAPEVNTQLINNVKVVQEMPQPISLDTINNGQSQPYDIFSMNMSNTTNTNNVQPLPPINDEKPSQYNSILADQNTNK